MAPMSMDSKSGPDTSGSGDGSGGSGGSADPIGSLGADSGPGLGARIGAVAGWVMRAAENLAHHQNDHVNRRAESGG